MTLASSLSFLVLMGLNYWIDRTLVGEISRDGESYTLWQLLMGLSMGCGFFTWGVADYLRGPGNGVSISDFRNWALIVCSFLVMVMSLIAILSR